MSDYQAFKLGSEHIYVDGTGLHQKEPNQYWCEQFINKI